MIISELALLLFFCCFSEIFLWVLKFPLYISTITINNMRLKEEQPQNPVEQKIEDLLIAAGHDQNEIQFRGGNWNEYQQRFETRYLRYDYWRNIEVADESEIWNYVSFECIFDDDCGNLHMFPLKNQYQPTKNSK